MERMHEEFLELESRGLIDWTLFPEGEKTDLDLLLHNYEAFREKGRNA